MEVEFIKDDPDLFGNSVDDFEVKYATVQVEQMGKIRVIGYGDSVPYPGTCICCGSVPSEDKSFIDFGKSIRPHGAVLFCIFCFSEVGRAIGWFNNKDEVFLELKLAAVNLKRENDELKVKLSAFERHRDAVGALVRNLSIDGFIDLGDIRSIENSEPNSGTQQRATRKKSEPDKLGSEQGSTDVLDDAKLNKLLET